jgi:hypothetical protein
MLSSLAMRGWDWELEDAATEIRLWEDEASFQTGEWT